MIESLRRPDSKRFKQLGLVIASHKKTLRAGNSKDDEVGASVVSADSHGHEMGAQLPASGSHMLSSNAEQDEGFSSRMSLIREGNILRRPPANFPWVPSVGLSHRSLPGSWEGGESG